MKRKLVYGVVSFILLFIPIGVFGSSYLKTIVQNQISKRDDFNCTFDGLRIHLLSRSIELNNIQITLKDPLMDKISLKSLKAQIQLLPLFRKKLVIQKISMEEGSIYLKQFNILKRLLHKDIGQSPRIQNSTLAQARLRTSLPIFLQVKDLRLEKIEFLLGPEKLLFVEQLALKNFLWDSNIKTTLFINFFLGADQDSPLYLNTQFYFDGKTINLVSINHLLRGFPLQNLEPFLGGHTRLRGVMNLATRMTNKEVLQVDLSWKDLQVQSPFLSTDFDRVIRSNPNVTARLTVTDLGKKSQGILTIKELALEDEILCKGITLKGPLPHKFQQKVYNITSLEVAQFEYHKVIDSKRSSEQGALDNFKAQIQKEYQEQTSAGRQELPLNIKSLKASQGTLIYEDRSKGDVRTLTIEAVTFVAQDIDFFHHTPSNVSFKGSIGTQGMLEIKGALIPLKSPLNFQYELNVNKVPIPLLSPFFPRKAKGYIDRGYLSMTSNGRCVNDQIKSRQLLVLEDLHFAGEGELFGVDISKLAFYLQNQRGALEIPFDLNGSVFHPEHNLKEVFQKMGLRAVTTNLLQNKGGDLLSVLGLSSREATANPKPTEEEESSENKHDDLKQLGQKLENQFKRLLFGQ
jgi:hypothetical protein